MSMGQSVSPEERHPATSALTPHLVPPVRPLFLSLRTELPSSLCAHLLTARELGPGSPGQTCLWRLRRCFEASQAETPESQQVAGEGAAYPHCSSQDALGAWEPGGREGAQLRSAGFNSMHH